MEKKRETQQFLHQIISEEIFDKTIVTHQEICELREMHENAKRAYIYIYEKSWVHSA